MPDERQSHPARRTIVASILLVVAAHLLLLIAVVATSRATALAATALSAAVSGGAVWIAAVGLVRVGRRLRDEQHRLVRALTDPVTGLPVRRVAEDAIVGTGPGVVLTVALADVDRLHEINRGPGGHAAGDRYLAETGRRLQQAAADGDVVARLGGDEFVLITRRTPQQVTDRLITAFAVPTAVTGSVRPVEVSVGISQAPGGDPHQLLGCASLAMVSAKDRGTRIEIYDPDRDGLPLPPGIRPAVRRRDRRRGTGCDGDSRVPDASDDLPPQLTFDLGPGR